MTDFRLILEFDSNDLLRVRAFEDSENGPYVRIGNVKMRAYVPGDVLTLIAIFEKAAEELREKANL